jgi:hypothetical protein
MKHGTYCMTRKLNDKAQRGGAQTYLPRTNLVHSLQKQKQCWLLFFQLQRCSAQGICSTGSNCKPRSLQRCIALFMWEHSMSLPWVVGNRELVNSTWQCTAAYGIIHQRTFVSTLTHCITAHTIFSRLVTFWFFLFPMTESSIERPSLSWHSGNSGLFQRPPEMMEAVYWCRSRLLWSRSLASECKYTTLILIPSVSKPSRHRAYFL